MEKQHHGHASRDSAIPPRPEERGFPRSLMISDATETSKPKHKSSAVDQATSKPAPLILSPFLIDNLSAEFFGARALPAQVEFARAIEKAVLQSKPVQKLIADTQRINAIEACCGINIIQLESGQWEVSFGTSSGEYASSHDLRLAIDELVG